MTAIETKNIYKTYVSGHFWNYKRSEALLDVTLKVEKKQVFGLLGLNGAGKTTLMKILLGLIKPSSGGAFILGKPAGDIQTRKKVAYLPEMPYFPRYLTPVEILNFHGTLYEIPSKLRKERIGSALKMVGLSAKKDIKLKEFSKGMLQRVGIASLLLNDGEVFFLDEPTYGLDPLATKEMRDIIFMLKKKGKTILLSSHQINEVKQICDRIGILHDKKLITDVKISGIKGPLETYFIKAIRGYDKKH